MPRLPKRQPTSVRAWSQEELSAFLDHVASHELFPVVRLIAATGLRRSEALGLPWRAVYLKSKRLQVVQTLVVVEEQPTIAPTTKNARSRRSISLDDETVRVLVEHRKRQTWTQEVAGVLWQDFGLCFTRDDGTPMRPAHLTRFVQAAALEAGVESIGVHGLRHTWATLSLEGGVHPKVVQERLGVVAVWPRANHRAASNHHATELAEHAG